MKNIKHILLFTLLVVLGMGVQSCNKSNNNDDDDDDTQPKKVWEIRIFGTPNCGNCTAFKNKLDSESVPYTFLDCTTPVASENGSAEMIQTISDAGMDMSDMEYPVVNVIVDGVAHVFFLPNYETDIKPLII